MWIWQARLRLWMATTSRWSVGAGAPRPADGVVRTGAARLVDEIVGAPAPTTSRGGCRSASNSATRPSPRGIHRSAPICIHVSRRHRPYRCSLLRQRALGRRNMKECSAFTVVNGLGAHAVWKRSRLCGKPSRCSPALRQAADVRLRNESLKLRPPTALVGMRTLSS